MSKPFDPSDLPDDVAQTAGAQVAAGRFASVEDVVRAGVENLAADAEDDAAARDHAWENYRKRAPADPRDMTASEVVACIDSDDPERVGALRAHFDALVDDLRTGNGLKDTPAEMMARIHSRLGVVRAP